MGISDDRNAIFLNWPTWTATGPPDQSDAILQRLRKEMHELALLGPDEGKRKLPDWFPKDYAPGDSPAKSPDLPAARKYVARIKGLSAEKLKALPPAQVLLLYIMGICHEDRDGYFPGHVFAQP